MAFPPREPAAPASRIVSAARGHPTASGSSSDCLTSCWPVRSVQRKLVCSPCSCPSTEPLHGCPVLKVMGLLLGDSQMPYTHAARGTPIDVTSTSPCVARPLVKNEKKKRSIWRTEDSPRTSFNLNSGVHASPFCKDFIGFRGGTHKI